MFWLLDGRNQALGSGPYAFVRGFRTRGLRAFQASTCICEKTASAFAWKSRKMPLDEDRAFEPNHALIPHHHRRRHRDGARRQPTYLPFIDEAMDTRRSERLKRN